MSSGLPRLVRAPNLVAYWRDGSFFLEEFVRRRQITAAPYVVLLLAAFERPRTTRDVTRDFSQYDARSVEKEIRTLLRLGFLVRAGRGAPPRSLLGEWVDSFPAIYYQWSSRDIRYVTAPKKKQELFEWLLSESPQPSLHKTYPRRRQTPLPERRPTIGVPLGDVLLERRTIRNFRKGRISFPDFADVIRGTFGQTGWLHAGPLGRLLIKTSPSAGARHPIECYVISWRIEDLPSGLYHYNVRTDRLERLRRGDFRTEAVRFASGQRWVQGAAFLCVMTAMTNRVFWKYRSPDAYRLFFLDAGHLAQTFTLLATEKRMGPFTTAAIQETKIERFLGLDGVEEFPVYLCGAGLPARRRSGSFRASDPISS